MDEPLGAMLMVEHGMADSSVIPLDNTVHLLGSLPSADSTLANSYVSRRHAEVHYIDGKYQIRDLGSKNGTFLNGSPVDNSGRWLHHGDRIELGLGQVVLRFETRSVTMTLPSSTDSESIFVDPPSGNVHVGETLLEPPLSTKEFAVLLLLDERRGKAFSLKEIAAQAWPERVQKEIKSDEIERCIRRLRLRLEPDPLEPRYILSARGNGYKLA